MVVRVNVHPRPVHQNYDLHLPWLANSYNQSNHGSQKYLSEFLDKIPTDETVCLVNNGEPISRSVAVKHAIRKYYSDVIIDSYDPLYSLPDPLFKNGYAIIPKPQSFDCKPLIDLYLSLYNKLAQFSHRYTYKFHDRDQGYFDAVKRHWYQFGNDMPPPPSPEHQEIYTEFQKLFEQLIDILKPVANKIGINTDDLRSNLMFRLNHNPPGSIFEDNLLVNRHADNSVLTAWLFENQPGGFIDSGQEHEENACLIDSLFDSGRQIILLPGFEYCDQTQCMTPATFHGVKKTNDHDRVSLVAFLKY
jgi:hypothetical protein